MAVNIFLLISPMQVESCGGEMLHGERSTGFSDRGTEGGVQENERGETCMHHFLFTVRGHQIRLYFLSFLYSFDMYT